MTITKVRIIMIAFCIAAFFGGWGTSSYAHDCGKQEPIKVKLGLDGTVPVEVTCTSEPVQVEVTCVCDEVKTGDEGPCENPPLEFEVEPAWNAGLAAGDHIISADFLWNIKKSRWDPYVQAVHISDYSEIQSSNDYSWYKDPTVISASDTKWLVGVRFSGKPKRQLVSGSDPSD